MKHLYSNHISHRRHRSDMGSACMLGILGIVVLALVVIVPWPTVQHVQANAYAVDSGKALSTAIDAANANIGVDYDHSSQRYYPQRRTALYQ